MGRRCRPIFRTGHLLNELLQLVVAGIATGAIYALVAVGFVLVWQTSQTINFAQGEFVMLPAFFVLAAMKFGHTSFAVALAIGMAASLLVLGVLFKRVVVDPVIRHGVLPLVISSIALALFLKESVKEFYAAEAQPFPPLWATTNVSIGSAVIAVQNIVIIAVAVVAVGALQLFLAGTRTGRCMQATAQNPSLARILGVRVDRMIMYTFLINAALVALASFLISPIYLAKFTNGENLGLAAFIAAIVGGFNQVRGAIIGGLLLGVLDNVVAAYLSAPYRAAIPLFLLIAVILFRPQGLLGRAEERTV
jgi:branched-chain amino acid transport system permease protein